jgi:anti-sigma B factor antagonist
MDTFGVPASRSELRFERLTQTDGAICLAVTGEVDMTTGDLFQQTLVRVLDEPGVARLRLDVAPLRFMDSNGVAVLVQACRTAERRGISFGIVNARGAIRSVLEMLGVYELLAAEEQGNQPGK